MWNRELLKCGTLFCLLLFNLYYFKNLNSKTSVKGGVELVKIPQSKSYLVGRSINSLFFERDY